MFCNVKENREQISLLCHASLLTCANDFLEHLYHSYVHLLAISLLRITEEDFDSHFTISALAISFATSKELPFVHI